MGMTREEAIESLQNIIEYWTYKPTEVEAAKMAIAALRPVSREQVEKVWRGEWVEEPYSTKSERNRIIHSKKCICSVCKKSNGRKKENFCPACGAPMTDEAVQMVMERINEMEEMKK